jgi:ABC-type transporter Mla subunit MlaD
MPNIGDNNVPLKRVFGFIRLLTALFWLVGSIAGLILLPPALDTLQGELDGQLDALLINAEMVTTSIEQTQAILEEVNDTLETVSVTTLDASEALTETRPLLDETAVVITEEVPKTLTGIQRTMPNVLQTMEDVERMLSLLSTFSFVIPNPLGQDFEIGLGIEYQPEIPMAQALGGINASLEGLAPSLEALEDDLDEASDNLAVLSDDLRVLTHDLDAINEELSVMTSQLDVYITNLEETERILSDARAGLPTTARATKAVLSLLLGVLACTQLPVLYLSWKQLQASAPRKADTAELKGNHDD